MSLKGILGSVFLLILLCVAGCMFMIRGCLSKYDERSAVPGVLYFENDTSKLLVAIVKYEKATSYQQNGGFISKSVSTTYFLQSNDGITGAKQKEQKIKDHEEVTEFPVEMLGAGGGLAWLYAGELLAYNPLTLEKIADAATLENKNPALKGKLPKQRRYYQFNAPDQSILITATDGTKWKLNTKNLMANASTEGDVEPYVQAITNAEEKVAMIEDQIDSLHKYNGGFKKDYYEKIHLLQSLRDSLNQEKYKLERLQQTAKSKEREIENLNGFNIAYSGIKTNCDTADNTFYGLYSAEEFKKISDHFYNRSEYDETARRQLYIARITKDRNASLHIDKQHPDVPKPSQIFLHGGFLFDKTTALPVRPGNNYLVVHKTVIGKDGKILLSKMNTSSVVAWTADTQLKEWIDYKLTSQQLYVFGADNPEISSTEINILLVIDLQNGHVSRYDYFTDKSL